MSRYHIYLTSRAEKDYKKLTPPVKERIKKAILQLEITRTPPKFKTLIGKDIAQYRIRIGDYRVLFDVNDDERAVFILRIGNRKDIYR